MSNNQELSTEKSLEIIQQMINQAKTNITDNGIGIPKDFNHKEAKSLGVQLIYMLADQIDAKLEVSSNNGTSYELCFKLKE